MDQHRADVGGAQFVNHARRFDEEFRADEIVREPAAFEFDEVPRAQIVDLRPDLWFAAAESEHVRLSSLPMPRVLHAAADRILVDCHIPCRSPLPAAMSAMSSGCRVRPSSSGGRPNLL